MPQKQNVKPRRLYVEQLESRELMAALKVVHNTTKYPARATVSLEQTYDTNRNGKLDSGDNTYICSGGMIDPNHVLTAAHCLFDPQEGGYPLAVVVRPGRTPTSAPFGAVFASGAIVPSAWQQGNHVADYGVLKLSQSVGNTTGWYGLLAAKTSKLKNTTLNLRHYPGSPFSGTQQYVSSGPAASVTKKVIKYNHNRISTFGGSSGAPLFFNKTKQIVGIHVRGSLGKSGPNEATRITGPIYRFIRNYLNQSESLNQSAAKIPGGTEYLFGDPTGFDFAGAATKSGTDVYNQMATAMAAAQSAAAVEPEIDATEPVATTTSTAPSNASTVVGTSSDRETNPCFSSEDAEDDVLTYQSAADDVFASADDDLALVSDDLPLVLA